MILTETAPGRYEGPLDLPAKGLWVVRSKVRAQDDIYFATERVDVR